MRFKCGRQQDSRRGGGGEGMEGMSKKDKALMDVDPPQCSLWGRGGVV